MSDARLIQGDCLDVMKAMKSESFDAIVTDPPAGINFMGQKFDSDRGGRAAWCGWLGERMAEAMRVANPGSYALVWAIPRRSHWTALALEDAGWEISDRLCQIFATGFPKHKSKLKPAIEDWWLCRRPAPKATMLQIDKCRVATAPDDAEAMSRCNSPGSGRFHNRENSYSGFANNSRPLDTTAGRWPSHCVLIHSPGCRAVGTRRVKGHNPDNKVLVGDDTTPNAYGEYARRSAVGHADADGLETVEEYQCIDGCPVAELDRQSGRTRPGERPARRSGIGYHSSANGTSGERIVLDSGGASRFFNTFSFDEDDFVPFGSPPNCDLCALLSWSENGKISWEHDSQEIAPCRPAKSAGSSSNPAAKDNDSVPTLAREGLPPGNGDSNPGVSRSADAAAIPSRHSSEIIDPSVPMNVGGWPVDQIARNAKSAANLCDSCATGIARNLAALRLGHSPESLPGPVSISEPKKLILNRSLVPLVEIPASTDTIPTIASLKSWFGSVRDAIKDITTSERSESPEGDGSFGNPCPTNPLKSLEIEVPYIYVSKASRRERNAGLEGMPSRKRDATRFDGAGGVRERIGEDGKRTPKAIPNAESNHHPTVKSLELMRWLVRLITPPGGTVLDPFMGSGTTGLACIKESLNFVGIESDPDYFEIASRRVAAARSETPLFDKAP